VPALPKEEENMIEETENAQIVRPYRTMLSSSNAVYAWKANIKEKMPCQKNV
jgi:hypothetical protein